METVATPRYCARCGARLANDNMNPTCRPCQRTAHDAALNPPDVPPEFWDNDQLRDALVRERHIGHVVRSYRKHPFHGQRPISQETVARWLSVSQTQLSRIESGRPLYDLERLVQWAKTLHIPSKLLWFALPDEGHVVNRSEFQTADAAAGPAGLPPAPAAPDSCCANNQAVSETCAQWLASELWNRSATALNAGEIPAQVLRVLSTLPPAGGLILRDEDGTYSFAHPSLIDFFVAQRIFGDLASGNSELLTAMQTSHDTDQVIRRFVEHDRACVPILSGWMLDGNTPVLRVNSAGILAKLGCPNISDQVINALRQDQDTRHLYLTAVASRVLAMPWEQAGELASGAASMNHAESAVRLSQEVRNSPDAAARWCSVVLLSRFAEPVPAIVTSALQETMRTEHCKETLRAIASALSSADPLES